MKISLHPIQLNAPSTASGSLVKRGALVAFRAVRVLTRRASEVPGALSQAASDIHAAWQESADRGAS